MKDGTQTVPNGEHNAHGKKKRQVSIEAFFLSLVIVFILGFTVSVYRHHIFAAIAPVFGVPTHAGELDTTSLQETYRALKANFDGELDDNALINGANRGLVEAAGDEYTVFMDAKERQEFDDSLSGSIGGGIGAEIGIRDDTVSIIRVLRDTPAEKADLRDGDKILSINDESTAGWTTTEAVAKIRGEVGTTVRLMIQRGDTNREVTITRAEITAPSVEYKIENGVGIVTISRFDQETARLTREAARSFVQGDVDGVIVDLRRNGGGYLTAAQDVAGLWLDRELVVTERAGDKVIDELRSGSNPLLAGIPTVVLVDEYSASASEIVAGALKDHGVATLVGKQTYGKGTVQKLVDLPFGAQLKVTVARWYTPKGHNISKEGIKPDIEAELSEEDMNKGNDTQLEAAKRALSQ